LTQSNLMLWNNLVGRIMNVQLNDHNDVFIWNLHQHGQYTVRLLYMTLTNNGTPHMNKQLWQLRGPIED
jgi:hypothetical protein